MGSTTMLALVLILGAVASAQKDDFEFGGGAPRRPPPPPADKPKPLWFVPSGPATKETRRSLSLPLPRSSFLRAQAPTSASSSPLPSLRNGSSARALATTRSPALRAAASTRPPAARGCRRSRRRWRRTFPPGSEPLLEAVMMSPAPPPPLG